MKNTKLWTNASLLRNTFLHVVVSFPGRNCKFCEKRLHFEPIFVVKNNYIQKNTRITVGDQSYIRTFHKKRVPRRPFRLQKTENKSQGRRDQKNKSALIKTKIRVTKYLLSHVRFQSRGGISRNLHFTNQKFVTNTSKIDKILSEKRKNTCSQCYKIQFVISKICV